MGQDGTGWDMRWDPDGTRKAFWSMHTMPKSEIHKTSLSLNCFAMDNCSDIYQYSREDSVKGKDFGPRYQNRESAPSFFWSDF